MERAHLGSGMTGGLRDELRRDPICPDLTPRPDGQARGRRGNSEPNARSQILSWFHCSPRTGPLHPKPQGVEMGLTYGSTGKGLCQPKPSLRIQFLHGRA